MLVVRLLDRLGLPVEGEKHLGNCSPRPAILYRGRIYLRAGPGKGRSVLYREVPMHEITTDDTPPSGIRISP